jgi:hypothetical protein
MSGDRAKCEICGEPMPVGEEMFKFHGYSGDCPKPPLPRVQSGAELIAIERERQITVEGYDADHDDGEHVGGELAQVAQHYVDVAEAQRANLPDWERVPTAWPWQEIFWKPSPDAIRNLTIAGALIAAEIDRLQRKAK